MKKRTFLKLSAITATGLAITPFYYSCNPTSSEEGDSTPEIRQGDFELPALPFAVEALAPDIDQRTMEIHHGKHHAGYVKKLNAAVAGTAYATMSLLDIIKTVKPDETAVRNNGGGHFNHTLFWKCLTPGGSKPGALVEEKISKAFGSFDQFKEQFAAAAKGRFGSGWAWLNVDGQGDLFISSTPNQDNPLMANVVEKVGTPVLGIDVWEHAYYLNYQNKRGDYIQNFFNVINWNTVEENLKTVLG